MKKKTLAFVLGIRPDVIRAALILNRLRASKEFDVKFIWSGQHYSDNLKDVFFRELNVAPPEIELGAGGNTDAEVASAVIAKLYPVLEQMRPEACVFLGDTNTVMGCLAAAQLNIPIVHIEGCMRAYDWRMPEEKCRTTIDHLSDVIYTYFDEYKAQGIAEGLNPNNIVVIQNLIVDILNEYYYKRKKQYDDLASDSFFKSRGIERGEYYVMTWHRRENVHYPEAMKNIVSLLGQTDRKVYLTASYRTQKVFAQEGIKLPPNVIVVDPIGYVEILTLMANSFGVLTDSGTIVEETCVMGIPTLQIRTATERPQVYDAGGCVKFDPLQPEKYPAAKIFQKLEALKHKTWKQNLGDGKATDRLVEDITRRMLTPNGFRQHLPERYHLKIARSYTEDGLA